MQAGVVATKGVLGDACAVGYRERRGMADGGAHVPEVLSAAVSLYNRLVYISFIGIRTL